MIKELTKLSQNHISFGSCAPAPLWGVEYALSNNTEAQIESTLVQDENILIEGLEKGDYSLIVLFLLFSSTSFQCLLSPKNVFINHEISHVEVLLANSFHEKK